MDIEKNKERFLNLCFTWIHREGIHELLNWLQETDFFTAPASTRFHGAYEGGLCEHCLNVFDMAMKTTYAFELDVTMESIAIATLFHDLCKVNYYKLDKRNQKIHGVWTEVPYYTVEEKEAFGGHGSKSLYSVMRFMVLSVDQASAINNHMGAFPGGDAARDSSNAYSSYPLAWITHVADQAATYLMKA